MKFLILSLLFVSFNTHSADRPVAPKAIPVDEPGVLSRSGAATAERKEAEKKLAEAKAKEEAAQAAVVEAAKTKYGQFKDSVSGVFNKAKEGAGKVLDAAGEAAAPALKVVDDYNKAQDPKNYKPGSCVWSDDIPRRIISAPSPCSKKAIQVCTGYVICEQEKSDAKFIRMSSCSSDLCGEADAAKCTEDSGYSSKKASEREAVSTSIRNKIIPEKSSNAQ